MRITDLSATASFLKSQYSKFGPLSTDPACLLRSYLLMLLTRKTLSSTDWVDELRRVPLYAIISGLIGNLDMLTVAGDGTPVKTCSPLRSKRLCNCRAQGIESCNRSHELSHPDCNSGWDSSCERYFYGYHLYMLTAADSPHDLPLFPRLQPASRHDSLSLVVSSVEFSHRFALATINRIILDAAHDAMGIYLQVANIKRKKRACALLKNQYLFCFKNRVRGNAG